MKNFPIALIANRPADNTRKFFPQFNAFITHHSRNVFSAEKIVIETEGQIYTTRKVGHKWTKIQGKNLT